MVKRPVTLAFWMVALWLLAFVTRVGGQPPYQGDPTGFFPHALSVQDLDRDGIPDLVVPASAARQVTVLLGDGRGGFKSNHAYPVAQGPTWVEVADLNGDGHLDFVSTNSGAGSLTIYFGDGKGGFMPGNEIQGLRGPASVVAGDFNRDGQLDLAVTQVAESTVAI